ncbi:MAG: hypothetical protein M1833_005263 [Piccolia ochrophora]|nr:MAG: hypothetical protein M1833_005263 [Piccolia ochrophora]
MPLIYESHDSLPYIDPDLTADERSTVATIISSELPPEHATNLHPSVPPLSTSKLSPLLEQEIARKAANEPLTGGIDTTRYEAFDPPEIQPGADAAESRRQWRDALQQAYTASSHLQTRLTNLTLLERFGKNAWLMGNAQLEDILRTLERELVAARERTDEVNKARKAAQENSRGELEGLTQAWQRGIGKIIEVEVAAETLRREILQRKREQAQGTHT